MLREFGVKGVKVQEVVSLDEEMMAFLQYGVPLFHLAADGFCLNLTLCAQ